MKPTLLLAALMTLSTPTLAQDLPVPPDVEKRPHVVKAPHGAERQDEYYWLRDDSRKDPDMLAYLNAENAYADAYMARLKPLEDRLYEEIVGRIKQDDSSVPYRERGWWYYSRFETGQDYPVYARRQGSMEAPEQVLLDVNVMAEGKDYFNIGDWEVSQDNRLLAWAEDDVGRRQYVIRIKDIETGKIFEDRISGVSANIVWADDNRTIFYVENDPETLLTVRVKKHVLGTPASEDVLVYEEHDDSFYMGIGRTRDDQYICIGVESTVSSEQRCAPAADPREFTVLAPRERDVEYDAEHHGDRWVIRTNADGAENFKIMTAPTDATSRAQWQEWIGHDADVFIDGFELFDGFTAVAERSGGLERIRLLRGTVGQADDSAEYVKADEPAYSMGLSVNSEPDTDWLRYSYTSLTTPATTYELNTKTGERRLLKQQPVIGYDPSKYTTERLWATARDGTRVPVTLVYRNGFEKDGNAAMLQYAYGSYGSSTDPNFNLPVVSLLDRGMVYALAHIRGGQEMGRKWYDAGKLLNKNNTFTDFIDVTRYLVEQGYAAPDRVAAYGGSAGGLLMGAIANMSPRTYDVILSQVPFVDVVTTMLDASIPLTTNEYDEWGNPEASVESYEYMLGYSPYDNLSAQAYPATFVGTGLWDSQVQYWEPAKYVARLRDLNTGSEPVLFRTNMDAGHGGKSGRFRRYRELAEMYAFMLDRLGVTEQVR
ncbi:S9 family peptidase [Novilysobacter spongiicola]|uniref:Oligopeptidase B. Serine peptidase. MEROPS family S09A n=1 Tax=Lysobacter spongiicola DSM 21749 TaxID=1122188 RepID=A0A1T4PMZ0_9GAMM|nr:S9 family peptidase [Lysobacter spongiicola]SJZ92954.1 oligopeptidase B . Serine peptidase. MEROPS family S09A [Lysobacter spongiicola DSM 21749]